VSIVRRNKTATRVPDRQSFQGRKYLLPVAAMLVQQITESLYVSLTVWIDVLQSKAGFG
jgi:hypothetical protein